MSVGLLIGGVGAIAGAFLVEKGGQAVQRVLSSRPEESTKSKSVNLAKLFPVHRQCTAMIRDSRYATTNETTEIKVTIHDRSSRRLSEISLIENFVISNAALEQLGRAHSYGYTDQDALAIGKLVFSLQIREARSIEASLESLFSKSSTFNDTLGSEISRMTSNVAVVIAMAGFIMLAFGGMALSGLDSLDVLKEDLKTMKK